MPAKGRRPEDTDLILCRAGGRELGAGEKRLAEVCREAGFANVRRAAETPTNMVLEVTG